MYHCPNCHWELPADARFCNNCGFTQIGTILSSSAQTQQELSSASSHAVQSPTDASSFLASQQAPKRLLQPTAKRTPAGRLRLPAIHTYEQRPSLQLPQSPERVASSSEQAPVLPVESVHTALSEDDLHPAQTPLKEENKPAIPLQPSLWIPGTVGLSLPSLPRPSVQGQLSTVLSEAPPLPEAQRTSQFREVNTVFIPATEPTRGQHSVPVTPLAPVEPLRWDIEQSSADAYNLRPPSTESIAATSKAAEHWRTSWRNRQLTEASPARGVSQAMDFSFWVTMILMLMLLCGLGAYSISTYLPGTQLASQLVPLIDGPQPTLTLVGTKSTIVIAGQTLHLHGEHFGINDAIMFVLETASIGSPVQSTLQGTFDASVTIPSNWLVGAYALEAQDNRTGKHAFLDIQVLPDTTTMDTTALSLEDAQGNPLTSLAFTSMVSKGDPQKQPIYLKNTSDTPLSWTVTAIADKNLGWLLVDGSTTSGILKARGTTSVTISVITVGLKIGSYTGHVILTVSSREQVILPITLTVVDTTVEVVITPNPIVAILQPRGICQPILFTLVNLSNTASIRWDVKGDAPYDQQHIALNGRPEAEGSLSPSGQEKNTAVLKVSCSGVRPGVVYKITVYYNDTQVHVPIIIRQSY
jgi:zinc-ribbon domain